MKGILANWNFIRIFRLLLGLAVIAEGIRSHEMLYALAGGLLTFMAFTNTGCCGPAGCSIQPPQQKTNAVTDVEFEEVKETTVK